MLPFSDLDFATLIKHLLEGKTPGYRLIVKEYFRIRYVSRSGWVTRDAFLYLRLLPCSIFGVHIWLVEGGGVLKKGLFQQPKNELLIPRLFV